MKKNEWEPFTTKVKKGTVSEIKQRAAKEGKKVYELMEEIIKKGSQK